MQDSEAPITDQKAEFIRIISEGGTLNDVAAALKINRATPLRWLREDESGELRNQYARAREDQGDLAADDVTEIARKCERGEIDPASARAAIDAHKWSAGKRKPKVYGDKIAVGGAADLPPVAFTGNINISFVDPENGDAS